MRQLILLLNFFFILTATYSQPLDPSFAGNGYTAVDFPAGNFYYENSVQVLRKSDGTYYVLFQVNGFPVLSHHFSNGNRDPNFGSSGYSKTINITDTKATLQPDGKVVIAGQIFDPATGTSDFGITRFNANGTLDKSFANDGVQAVDFLKADDASNAIIVQPDGKIVIAGRADDPASGRSHFALARLNTNGALDASFDGDGKQLTDFADGYDEINAISIGTDKKIVAAGETYNPETGFSRMAVARYNADGSPDKSFSGEGKTTTGFPAMDAYANDLAVQPNGKIILAGHVGESFLQNSAIALVRYNANGTLDNTFSGDGKVTTNLFDSTAVANSVVLQSNGRIIIGGYGADPTSDNSNFLMLRYTANGTPDNSFGKSGIVTTDFDGAFDEVSSIILQPDGHIVAAGVAFNRKADNGDYALARYDANGSLDKKFGRKGTVTDYYDAGSSRMNAVAVQADGKVLVAGGAYANNNLSDFGLTRYNANGTVDKGFGDEGKVTTDFLDDNDEAFAMAVQPDGKIVLAGFTFNNTIFRDEFAIARYNPNGSPDKKFGRKGKIVTALKADNISFGGLALQPDGKIVVAGSVSYEGSVGSNGILLRYTVDGEPDKSFDGDGKAVTEFTSFSDEFFTSVALQTDGKIVAAGYGFSATSSNFILARYNANGALDKSFDNDGKVVTAFSSDVFATAMAIQPDGKIVVGGDYFHFDTDDYDFALARYNSNGSLDKSFDTDGRQVTDINNENNSFGDLALQQDGKLLVLGLAYNTITGNNDVSLTRYTTAGVLDKTFGEDGSLLTQFPGYYNYPTGLAIRNNKAFVITNVYTPAQTNFLAAFSLGNAGTTPQIVNHQLTGVAEKVSLAQLSVKAQPNPATQFFSLRLQSKETTAATVIINDAKGRLVEMKSGVASNSTLQIGRAYKPGVYYVEVIQGTAKSVVTLVKQ